VIVSALTLFVFTVAHLAQILGADQPFDASGTVLWMSLLFAFVAFAPANFQWSGVAALATAIALGIAWLALIDKVFSPEEVSTFRWMLLIVIAGYVVAAVRLSDRRPRHSVHMVNGAALATLVLLLTFLSEFVAVALISGEGGGGGPQAGWGWEVLLVILSFGLIAYAVAANERGPGYLGFIVLFFTITLIGAPKDEGEGSLIGWPIVFLLLTALVLAAAMTGRRPGMRGAPASGGSSSGGTAPGAATPAPDSALADERADVYEARPPDDPPPPPPSSGPPAGETPPPGATPTSGDEPTERMDEPPGGQPPPPR
jgi:hypothetical protein